MKKYEFFKSGMHFIRIDKKTARRAYNNGLTVVFCPVNLEPGAPWYPETNFRENPHFDPDYEKDTENTFDYQVNCFERGNCTNTKTGYYTAFYIPVVWVDRFNEEPSYSGYYNATMQYDYNFVGRCYKYER